METMSGRIGFDAVITLIAMIVMITALSAAYSTAVLVVGFAAAVFVAP